MTGSTLALLASLAALVIGLALLIARLTSDQGRLSARLLRVQQRAGIDQVGSSTNPRERAARALQTLGGGLIGTGILSGKTVADFEQTLQSAGFRGDRALTTFVGAKIISLVGVPALAWLILVVSGQAETHLQVAMPVALVIGLLLPDFVAKQLRKRYLHELERALPDALDLMVICAEAGLALETTIERVATEIGVASSAMATEFSLCNSELRILADRRAALMNMADRTGIEQIRRLAVTLTQALKLGTPLVQALRSLSAEMRQDQLTRAEERAAKLPVLLTVPMIIFILPTLIIVTVGPAMIELWRVL
jgi:tight adherence protein C